MSSLVGSIDRASPERTDDSSRETQQQTQSQFHENPSGNPRHLTRQLTSLERKSEENGGLRTAGTSARHVRATGSTQSQQGGSSRSRRQQVDIQGERAHILIFLTCA